MCLTRNYEKTKEFFSKNKNNKDIVVWKVLRMTNSGKIKTPLYSWTHNPITVKPNHELIPNQKMSISYGVELMPFNQGGCCKQEDEINSYMSEGVIHVFISQKRAKKIAKKLKKQDKLCRENSPRYIVVKCTANIDDYVACGNEKDAVFLKILIGSEIVYDTNIKKPKKLSINPANELNTNKTTKCFDEPYILTNRFSNNQTMSLIEKLQVAQNN